MNGIRLKFYGTYEKPESKAHSDSQTIIWNTSQLDSKDSNETSKSTVKMLSPLVQEDVLAFGRLLFWLGYQSFVFVGKRVEHWTIHIKKL
jgi:hypothetical protein